MAWDAGEEVAVAGQPFGGALRLTAEAAREDAIDRRVASAGRQYVRGWARRTDAGVTALKIGLETQTEARDATATALFSIPLGAVGTWAAFSGYVDTAAGHVWARPYLEAVGGVGEFAEIYIGDLGALAGRDGVDWADVTDDSGARPEDNATVGAVFGGNLQETPGGDVADLADFKTILGTAGAILGQGDLATSALSEEQVQGRYLGAKAGDAAAAAAGLQDGDLYLDNSVFPNRLRGREAGVVSTISAPPGSVSATGPNTAASSGATWVLLARAPCPAPLAANPQALCDAELDFTPDGSPGFTTLLKADGTPETLQAFNGTARVMAVPAGSTSYTSQALVEFGFTLENSGSGAVVSVSYSGETSSLLKRLSLTGAVDFVLVFQRASGAAKVEGLGGTLHATVFGGA